MAQVNKNISKRQFRVLGFDNSESFNLTFSLAQLMSNDSNDTELLYTLQDDIDAILDLQVEETFLTHSQRSFEKNNNSIVLRIQ